MAQQKGFQEEWLKERIEKIQDEVRGKSPAALCVPVVCSEAGDIFYYHPKHQDVFAYYCWMGEGPDFLFALFSV